MVWRGVLECWDEERWLSVMTLQTSGEARGPHGRNRTTAPPTGDQAQNLFFHTVTLEKVCAKVRVEVCSGHTAVRTRTSPSPLFSVEVSGAERKDPERGAGVCEKERQLARKRRTSRWSHLLLPSSLSFSPSLSLLPLSFSPSPSLSFSLSLSL